MEEQKKNIGGRREGAGRKLGSGKKEHITVRLDKVLLNSFPDGVERTRFINDAVREKMQRDGIHIAEE